MISHVKKENLNVRGKTNQDTVGALGENYVVNYNNAVDQILASPDLCSEFRSVLSRQNIQTSAGVRLSLQKFAETKIAEHNDFGLGNDAAFVIDKNEVFDKADEKTLSKPIYRSILKRSSSMKPPGRSLSDLSASRIGWASFKSQSNNYDAKTFDYSPKNENKLRANITPSPRSTPKPGEGACFNNVSHPQDQKPKTNKKNVSALPPMVHKKSVDDSLSCLLEKLNISLPILGSGKPNDSFDFHRMENLPGRRCSHMSCGSMEHYRDNLKSSDDANDCLSFLRRDSFSSMSPNTIALKSFATKTKGKNHAEYCFASGKNFCDSKGIEKIRACPTNPAFRKWRRRESTLVDNHHDCVIIQNGAGPEECGHVQSSPNRLLRNWVTHEMKRFPSSSEKRNRSQVSLPVHKKMETTIPRQDSQKSNVISLFGYPVRSFGMTGTTTPTSFNAFRNDDACKSSYDDLNLFDSSDMSSICQDCIRPTKESSSTKNNLLLDWGDLDDYDSDGSAT